MHNQDLRDTTRSEAENASKKPALGMVGKKVANEWRLLYQCMK
jgi:hypothetical protein